MPSQSQLKTVFKDAKERVFSQSQLLSDDNKKVWEYLEKMSAERISRHKSFMFEDGLSAELVFIPQIQGHRVKFDDAGNSDGLQTTIKGQVVGFLTRSDGQIMTVDFGAKNPIELNDFMGDGPILGMTPHYEKLKNSEMGIKAFTEGKSVNSFFRPDHVYRQEGAYIRESSNVDFRQWVPLMTPEGIGYFGPTPFGLERDDFDSYNAMNSISEKLKGENSFSLRIDFSRLSDRLIFDLSQEREVFEEFKQSLADASEADKLSAMPLAYEAAIKTQQKRLHEAGIVMTENDLDKYPLPALNYIASAEAPETRRYRKEFIDTCYQLMHPNKEYIAKVNKLTPRTQPFSATRNVLDLVEGGGGGLSFVARRLSQTVQEKIDVGHFPAKEIAEIAGMPHMSKKQFSRALNILGNSEEMRVDVNGDGYIPGIRKFESLTPEKAFAFARLPVQWWRWDDEHPDLLTDQTMGKVGSNELGKLLDPLIIPLINTAKKIDRYQHEKNKKGLKEISSQWHWFTQSGKSMEEKLKAFDEKYKLSSSFNDYPRLLEQMLNTVNSRMVMDAPLNNMDEIFVADIDDGSLTIDEDELYKNFVSILEEEHERELYNVPDDWDEEEDGPYDPIPIYEDFSSIDLPSSLDINARLNKQEFSLKRLAELNQKLHVDYTKIIRQCNEGSPHQITWEPLTDSPIELGGGLVATTIDNRLDLLEEGQVMDHCVFSYLNRCLRGESVILSVKDTNNDNERVATIELEVDDPDEETLSLTQCFGYRNTSDDNVESVRVLMEEWVEEVNEKRIETRLSNILESDVSTMGELEKVIDNPSQEGSLLCTIPYDSDGAYLAAFLFEKYTPPSISIEDVFESNQGTMELYYRSSLSEDLRKLREIAVKWGVKPEKVVEYKIRHKVHLIDDLEPHRSRKEALLSQWATLHQQSFEAIPTDEMVKRCESMLTDFNGEVFADQQKIANELSKEKPDWKAVWQQAAPKKEDPAMTPVVPGRPVVDESPENQRLRRAV